MSDCGHTPKYPDLHSVPTLQECMSHCQIVADEPSVARQRALTSEDGETTRLDQGYWSGLNDAQKAAVIAHERAHPCIGMQVNCEGCADKVGGYFMRAWGYCPSVVRSSFASLRVQRKPEHGNIADNAYHGARYAERGLAERGLYGASSLAVTDALAKERALLPSSAIKPTTTTSTAPPPTPATAPATGSTTASGTGSTPLKPIAQAPLTPTQTAAQGSSPGAPATATESAPVDALNAGVAGDVVSAVLGENARAHTGKVLIAAGAAAMVAIVLVVLVRRRS